MAAISENNSTNDINNQTNSMINIIKHLYLKTKILDYGRCLVYYLFYKQNS